MARPTKVPAARAPVSRDAVVRFMRRCRFREEGAPAGAFGAERAATWAHASDEAAEAGPRVVVFPRGLRGGSYEPPPSSK